MKPSISQPSIHDFSPLQYVAKIAAQQKEIEDLRAGRLGPYVQALHPHTDLEKLPLHTLKALQTQLRQDLETVEKVSVVAVQG